ncbi:MAG TPA: hypothetical protein VIG76_04285 [Amnibacterium sp.]|uniref:hypothetical protein n=1 Tax=Amnibacterium sp. TaxID=1872496 RepID=UPI002F92EB58
MSSEPIDLQAERLFKAARRGERLWPLAIGVALLYLLSTCWSFSRALGGSGLPVTVHAHPTVWVPLALAAVVVATRVLGRLAEESGGSPFWWPRQSRRLLIGLAFALPVLLAAVQPAMVLMQIDAGDAHPATLGAWLVGITATP